MYFHAMGGLVKAMTSEHQQEHVRPGVRTPPALPHVTPRLPQNGATSSLPPRNVLFILTESVRADAHCSSWSESCPIAPRTNAAVPKRFPLLQMRSNSSTTAIQLAVLWSGLEPTASREDLHTYPLLFDYAHAAGYDTAYWTSHHMMFANSRLYVRDLPTSHQCGGTDLDPLADIDLGGPDELLVKRAIDELPELNEPFFAVAHVGNTHLPYRIDPSDAPFQPALVSKAEDDNEAYRNYYKNAVHFQDKSIAELIRFVRSSPFGSRTIIVFTSDHGEAFREHGQLLHTGAVLDEEIHVPAWIDAPEGTLSESEVAALRSARDAYVFHTDVAPTILDLLGLWEEPAFAKYRAKMVGSSLVRPERKTVPLALTNCSGIWGCAFRNWGMMRGSLKLEAREWHRSWHCFDVAKDPREEHDLGPEACGDLVPMAEAIHGGPPGGR
jgi:arylsulfatase A-like enzyme